ncbi:MAG TPA: FeoB-associated Cys-rich membrane protein [Pseudomonadales bacterium]|nr:FeoB-associated Cys-rich membrane protein [Pseudomonadales bacterium]
MWQEIIVAVIVLVAVAYWIKKLLPMFSKKPAKSTSACGSCNQCSGNSGGCH